MTGMRRGEVCGLRWSDVDLDRARIDVRHQLLVVRTPGAPDGGLLFSDETKTKDGRRSIDLDPATRGRAQDAEAPSERAAVGEGPGWSNEHDLVFTEPDGRPLDPESVAKVFMLRVARSGLPVIRFHDLRHTHVAHLIEAGEQPLLIRKRLGHASVGLYDGQVWAPIRPGRVSGGECSSRDGGRGLGPSWRLEKVSAFPCPGRATPVGAAVSGGPSCPRGRHRRPEWHAEPRLPRPAVGRSGASRRAFRSRMFHSTHRVMTPASSEARGADQ